MGLLQCRPVINTANIQLPAGWPFIDKNQRPAVLTPDTSGGAGLFPAQSPKESHHEQAFICGSAQRPFGDERGVQQ
jgi:hypothetical protein